MAAVQACISSDAKQDDELFLVDIVASMTHDNGPNPTMPNHSGANASHQKHEICSLGPDI